MFKEKLTGDLENGVKFELIVTGNDQIEVLKQMNAAYRRILGVPDVIELTHDYMDFLRDDDLERSWKLPTKGREDKPKDPPPPKS
jgi:hypothetical protein